MPLDLELVKVGPVWKQDDCGGLFDPKARESSLPRWVQYVLLVVALLFIVVVGAWAVVSAVVELRR